MADGGAHGGALGASWFRPVGGSGQGGQTMVARGECDCQGGDNLAFPSNTLACSVLWPEAVARQGLWPGAGSDCQIAQEFFPLHSQDSGLARKWSLFNSSDKFMVLPMAFISNLTKW